MEKYFSHSIEKSVYHWNEDVLQELEALVDKNRPYESPVSANLFTSFSERSVCASIFALIFFIVLINFILAFIKKRAKAISI